MEKKPILVVDDEKNIRLTMSQSLESLEIPIQTAVNGEEALQKAARGTVRAGVSGSEDAGNGRDGGAAPDQGQLAGNPGDHHHGPRNHRVRRGGHEARRGGLYPEALQSRRNPGTGDPGAGAGDTG